MGYNPVNFGTTDGDHTGDKARVVFAKYNLMFQQLFGETDAGIELHVTLTTLDYIDYDPGSGWPALIGRLLITCSTGDVRLLSLKAGGYDGQVMLIENDPASVGNVRLPVEYTTGTTAADRFMGNVTEFDILPGRAEAAIYSTGDSRWHLS